MSALVGRGQPLARVEQALHGARAGHGGLVLVSGEAGIGKSRLAEAALTAAEREGMLVGRGSSVDDPGCPPLWPWLRLSRQWPELATALRQAAPDPVGVERFQLFVEASELLVERAEPAGLALLLEDLHWADRTSLLLLRHLTAELPRSRLLVLATVRSEHAGPLDEMLPFMLSAEGTLQIRLQGLSETEVATWLGLLPNVDDPVGLARLVTGRTRGNPLLIRLLTDALAVAGRPVGDDPRAIDRLLSERDDLRHLVAARVRRLTGPGRRVVEAASVAGTGPVQVLADILELSVGQVEPLLDEAVRAGVLCPGTEPRSSLEFVHALVRDAISAGLTVSARADLHRRTAIALALQPRPPASLVAHHWRRSAAPESTRHCGDWAVVAVAEAMSARAYDEAVSSAELALACARELGVDDRQLAAVLLTYATARFSAGQVDEPLLAALTEVADLGERLGSLELIAAAGLVIHGIGTPEINRVIRRICVRALRLLDLEVSSGQDHLVTRARLLAQVAVAAAEDEGGLPAVQMSGEAVAAAEASKDPEAVLEALAARHLALTVPDQVEERIQLGRRAVDLGVASRQPFGELWGHLWLVDAAFQLGNLAELDRELAEVDRIARLRRSPLARWHHTRLCATYAALLGDLDRAGQLNVEARAVAEQMGNGQAISLFYAFTGQLGLVRGDLVEWSTPPEQMLEGAPHLPLVEISVAVDIAQRGDLDRARAVLARYRDLPRTLPKGTRWAPTLGMLGFGAVLLGDAELARAVYDELRPTSRYYGGDGSGAVFCHGFNARLVGDLALTAGLLDEAVNSHREGLAMNVRVGARAFVVLSQLGLVKALLAHGPTSVELDQAAVLVQQAAGEARRLGLPGPLREAAELTERVASASRVSSPLSVREAEVAQLVATGLSNRQVAEQLILSERTVESHVRSILAKLRLRTRHEITGRVGTTP